MAEYTPDKILDCSGLKCPMPLVKTTKTLKSMESGKILEMISTDPGSELDVTAWAKQTQNELLALHKGETGEWHFLIKKK
ncbi:sulfurtransferase TusA family protein [candidate division KSB1 bacterium]|nr:sulfurtransferase TusA family protein [candidate division KSB1 bacterium]